MKSMIKPPLVLTIICTIIAGLVIAIYNITYVDNTGVVTKKMKQACEAIVPADDYTIILEKETEGEKKVLTFGKVANVIKVKDNNDVIIMNVIGNGYEKKSINTMIALDKDAKVLGVSIVSLNETPGLGTKIKNEAFLSKFKDKATADEVNAIDGVTAATYSSEGLKDAIITAQKTLKEHKEAIFGE